MADANEPGAAVLAIFDQLINRIKSARPIRSDKKPAELGFVYSQLVLGMMVDPRDYMGPWSPAGATSMQDAIEKGHAPPAASGTPAPGASATAPPPDQKYLRAMDAATGSLGSAPIEEAKVAENSDDCGCGCGRPSGGNCAGKVEPDPSVKSDEEYPALARSAGYSSSLFTPYHL